MQDGITLIALIITVIVMIILVAVTVTVALDGGLFDKAKTATEQTEQNAIYETIVSAMEIDNNGNIIVSDTASKAKTMLEAEGKTAEFNDTTGIITVTGKSGKQYEYTITDTQIVIGKKEAGSDLDKLKSYLFGESGDGKKFYAESGYGSEYGSEGEEGEGIFDGGEFINYSGILDETPTYKGCDYSGDVSYYYIEYKDMIYKFATVDDDENTSRSKGISVVGAPIKAESTTAPEVGSIINYDSKNWIVMYKDTSGIQMISEDALKYNDGYLYLGSNDTYLSETGHDATFTSLSTNLEKSIYSYNHAITTLNSVCASLVNTAPSYITGVRCVGSNSTNPSTEASGYYTSPIGEKLASWHEGAYNGKNGGKNTDDNYVSDYEILVRLGKTVSKNEEGYWLASRFVNEDSDGVDFGVRYVDGGGGCSGNLLWSVRESYAYGGYSGRCIRPVVSLQSGLQYTYHSENDGYFTINN